MSWGGVGAAGSCRWGLWRAVVGVGTCCAAGGGLPRRSAGGKGACYRSSMETAYLPVPEADDAFDATSDSHVVHVRGVRAGPQAVAELTRIFSQFGKVKDVVVRERFSTPEGSEPDAPTVDTSWALVTMSSNAAVAAALRDGVHERMDSSHPLTLSRFSSAIAPRPLRDP